MHNHPFSYNTYITGKKKKKAENEFQSPLNTTGVVQTEENLPLNPSIPLNLGFGSSRKIQHPLTSDLLIGLNLEIISEWVFIQSVSDSLLKRILISDGSIIL